ncbi:uncharacterized protein [Triticum aestivum]|uniref:uncharacterized protein n=1 Tax=Triticum aestivum TaxID=4565 RepID=UPI001D01178A|nr:uncharacterized protein LOC123096999 [Triticum aestivum]
MKEGRWPTSLISMPEILKNLAMAGLLELNPHHHQQMMTMHKWMVHLKMAQQSTDSNHIMKGSREDYLMCVTENEVSKLHYIVAGEISMKIVQQHALASSLIWLEQMANLLTHLLPNLYGSAMNHSYFGNKLHHFMP